jgi:hypothetical protein
MLSRITFTKISVVWLTALVSACAILFDSCRHDTEDLHASPEYTLRLKWFAAYPGQQRVQAETAFMWTLSYLGAELPAGSFKRAVQWRDSTVMEIDFSKAGFTPQALLLLYNLKQQFERTQEYQFHGAVDMGRFIALTIGSSKHYYAITGAAPLYNDYRQPFQFDSKMAALTVSTVAKLHRLIEFSVYNTIYQMAFVALEGPGRLDDGTFIVKEMETLDIMRNGQIRAGIYQASDSALHDAADTLYSIGGKPAKCLWCHELYISPSFASGATDVPGYYSHGQFQQKVADAMSALTAYRNTLNGEIDYTRLQDHAQMEIAYISFMEPSAYRLAQEWKTTMQEVQQRMSVFTTHPYWEYPFLGELYFRTESDMHTPYQSLRPPTFVREQSAYEPDLLP